jgi:hypothetical protein
MNYILNVKTQTKCKQFLNDFEKSLLSSFRTFLKFSSLKFGQLAASQVPAVCLSLCIFWAAEG